MSGGFNESLPVCEDYDLWLRISKDTEVPLIPEALVTRRGGHADQLSRSTWGFDRFRVTAIANLLEAGLDPEKAGVGLGGHGQKGYDFGERDSASVATRPWRGSTRSGCAGPLVLEARTQGLYRAPRIGKGTDIRIGIPAEEAVSRHHPREATTRRTVIPAKAGIQEG